jgi:NitT/TauT family transport system ATP-binding protein
MAESPLAIQVSNVGKVFATAEGSAVRVVEAVRSVSFEVKRGEFFSILGPSGSGKTTCLRILAGLLAKDAGSVAVHGTEVTGPSRDRAMVFQSFNLLPWKTIAENTEFGLKLQGIGSRTERRERARRYLELVGLKGFEDHYPHQLSGGMQQRVGIARALAIEPSVLLMDEPFASVDAQTREVLQGELLKILAATDATIVFITHSIDEAIYLSDEVIVLSARPSVVLGRYRVNLPKPRWEYDVHVEPEFVHLRSEAWKMLRPPDSNGHLMPAG